MRAILLTILLSLVSCGGENKGNPDGDNTVTGNEFQAAISSCSNGRSISINELDNIVYSKSQELGRVYPGLTKRVVESSNMNTYDHFGNPISCLIQTIKESVVVSYNGYTIYSLVKERRETNDSKIECQRSNYSKEYILSERKDPMDLFSRVSFNFNNALIKVLDLKDNSKQVCLQNKFNSSQQFTIKLAGPIWNSEALSIEDVFSQYSNTTLTKRVQTYRLADQNTGHINIYNYQIIHD